jgi:hypothetical protein
MAREQRARAKRIRNAASGLVKVFARCARLAQATSPFVTDAFNLLVRENIPFVGLSRDPCAKDRQQKRGGKRLSLGPAQKKPISRRRESGARNRKAPERHKRRKCCYAARSLMLVW